MKKVVITGVSTGIGYSSAKILCNEGYMVFGSVRNEKDAMRLLGISSSNFNKLYKKYEIDDYFEEIV